MRNLAPAEPESTPLEYERILDEDDFSQIRQLRHEKMVKDLMRKHGLKSAAKRERLLAAAEDEAEEALAKKVPSLFRTPDKLIWYKQRHHYLYDPDRQLDSRHVGFPCGANLSLGENLPCRNA